MQRMVRVGIPPIRGQCFAFRRIATARPPPPPAHPYESRRRELGNRGSQKPSPQEGEEINKSLNGQLEQEVNKRYISPFSKLAFEGTRRERPDINRGIEASKRYVREGVLDPRYRADARRVTAIICALPVVIVTSYFLWQRLFAGVEKKELPTSSGQSEEEEVENVRGEVEKTLR